MKINPFIRNFVIIAFLLSYVGLSGCGEREQITNLEQLKGKEFAVPTGTIADELVLSRFPDAEFKYFNNVLDACLAVKGNKADAAAYDEPILKNIAAKNSGLKVLPEMITTDNYGFAVRKDEQQLKEAIDSVLEELRANGKYDDMMNRWLPEKGRQNRCPK
ncbi:MAG: transporter substrate-binding domain-containing protein [Bacteroidales bacterium]|nr:transporter substrate-binding domain-containing protein [Bacteroidales bacterium]